MSGPRVKNYLSGVEQTIQITRYGAVIYSLPYKDGEFVKREDYEALQKEIDKLRALLAAPQTISPTKEK